MTLQEGLRGILIDPETKSITEVISKPYPAWKELINVQLITSVTLHRYPSGAMETLWVDDEGLINEKQNGPYFKVKQHGQPMAGKGIIFGTDEQGETVSTNIPIEMAEDFVSWPNVHFIGLQPIPEHEEDHPLFGHVFVVGSVAQFEDGSLVDPDDKDKEKGD